MTILGVNFAGSDTTSSMMLGSSACQSTSWTTVTSVRCFAPVGVGANNPAVMTVAAYVGTGAGIFSYDAPVISRANAPNAQLAVSSSMTIEGTTELSSRRVSAR